MKKGQPALAALLLLSALSAIAQTAPPPESGNSGGAPSSESPAPTEPESTPPPQQQPVEELPTIPVPVTEAKEPPPKPEKDAKVLEDVVVTATRRKQSVREVTMTIDAFTGEDLERRGLTQLDDIVRYSPGVMINKYYGPAFQQVQIRGISTGASGRAVGLFLDDIALTNPSIAGTQPDLDAFDLDRVEIIKGPVGTLFGGSALAGALRYIPMRPNLDHVEGRLLFGGTAAAEGHGWVPSYGAMFNLPLGSSFGIRAAGILRATPGVYDDLTSGINRKDVDRVDKINARVLATWLPFEHMRVDGIGYNWRVRNDRLGFADNDQRFERSNTPGPQYSYNNEWYAQLKARYDFDSFGIEALGGYVNKTNDSVAELNRALVTTPSVPSLPVLPIPLTLPLPGLLPTNTVYAFNQIIAGNKAVTGELRLQSSAPSSVGFFLLDGWDWSLGGVYYRADQTNGSPLDAQTPNGVVTAANTFAEADARETAVFGDITRHLFDSFEVNLGLRYFRQVTDVFAKRSPVVSVPPVGPENVESINGQLRANGLNPKVAVKYKLNRNFMAYLGSARGFRYGGLNAVQAAQFREVTNVPLTYQSDYLWSYELGLRTTFFRGALQGDIAVYYIDWQNLQVAQRSELSAFITNAGAARSRGLEGGLRAFLPLGFNVTFNGALTDAALTEPFNQSAGNVTSGDTLPAGTPLPSAPRYTGALTLGYKKFLWGWGLSTSVAATNRSSFYDYLGDPTPEKGFTVFDASFQIDRPDWPFKPSLNFSGTNLTNVRTVITRSRVSLTDSAQQDVFFLQPRMLKATIEARF